MSVAIRILYVVQGSAKIAGKRNMNCSFDLVSVRGAIQNIGAALTAFLAYANIDHRKLE